MMHDVRMTVLLCSFLAVLLRPYIDLVPVQEEEQSLDKGYQSCATALTDTQIDEEVAALMASLASLLTALNAIVPPQGISIVDDGFTVNRQWIRHYCAAHPQHTLMEALAAFLASLGPSAPEPQEGEGRGRMTLDERKKLSPELYPQQEQ